MRNKTFPMRLNQTIKWNRVNKLNKMERYLNNQQKEFKNPIQMCKFPKIRKMLIKIKRQTMRRIFQTSFSKDF